MDQFKIQLDNQADAEFIFEQIYNKANDLAVNKSDSISNNEKKQMMKSKVNKLLKGVWHCLVQNTQVNGCDWSRTAASSSSDSNKSNTFMSEFEPIDEAMNRRVDSLSGQIETALLEVTRMRREMPALMMALVTQSVEERRVALEQEQLQPETIATSRGWDLNVVKKKINNRADDFNPENLFTLSQDDNDHNDDDDFEKVLESSAMAIKKLSNSLAKVTDKMDRALTVLDDYSVKKAMLEKEGGHSDLLQQPHQEEGHTPTLKRLREQDPFSPIYKPSSVESINGINNNNNSNEDDEGAGRKKTRVTAANDNDKIAGSPAKTTPRKASTRQLSTPKSVSLVKQLQLGGGTKSANRPSTTHSNINTSTNNTPNLKSVNRPNTTQNTPSRSSPRIASSSSMSSSMSTTRKQVSVSAMKPRTLASNPSSQSPSKVLASSASASPAMRKIRRADHPLQRQI